MEVFLKRADEIIAFFNGNADMACQAMFSFNKKETATYLRTLGIVDESCEIVWHPIAQYRQRFNGLQSTGLGSVPSRLVIMSYLFNPYPSPTNLKLLSERTTKLRIEKEAD